MLSGRPGIGKSWLTATLLEQIAADRHTRLPAWDVNVPYVARAASFSRWAKEGPACNDHERRANPYDWKSDMAATGARSRVDPYACKGCHAAPWRRTGQLVHRIEVPAARHGSAAHPIRNSLGSSGL
jgi:hypothetical protein